MFAVCLLILALSGCNQTQQTDWVDATEHGLSAQNSGQQNCQALQSLIDSLTETGGTIYIPAGEYVFAENGTQTIGSHCIQMRSHVSIVGDGEKTVLKPVGESTYGLDMFYFNEYLDTGEAAYLENCQFENFVIDAAGTSCQVYTSAGKGFMFNLFRDCHWKGVTVKNTDATGFGVDCPLDSSITNCTAIGCGKAATEENGGASGFGIGYGYCDGESITITDCYAEGNRKFGVFFEHQGRFDPQRYTASEPGDFLVKNCIATGNLYNFGGIMAEAVVYDTCVSAGALRVGYYFENCENCRTPNCKSENDPLKSEYTADKEE